MKRMFRWLLDPAVLPLAVRLLLVGATALLADPQFAALLGALAELQARPRL